MHTIEHLGYKRHNLESVERYVIRRNLGYCIVFYLFHDFRNIIVLVLAEPILLPVCPFVRPHDTHDYLSVAGLAETDRLI